MKIRSGFVSNSASASFVIKKSILTKKQLNFINDHINVYNARGYKHFDHGYRITDRDAWEIQEIGDRIVLSTDIDNFDMKKFLEYIGVDVQTNMKLRNIIYESSNEY